VIPQPYPLYARVWIAGDTTTDTAAIIGWTPTEDDPTFPANPIVAFLNSHDPREGPTELTDEWRWRITTHPDDDWTPGDPT
jgi:hypothetical protein